VALEGKRSVFAATVAATAWLAVLPASPAILGGGASGCAGDDCDSDTASWGSCTQGDRLDATHWESTPATSTSWLDFHGERTWTFDPSPWMGTAKPFDAEVDLAFNPLPNGDGGGGFAQSAGNLAEVTFVQVGDVWKVVVQNDTCAQYYVRVVLTYPDGVTPTRPGACIDGGT
jgi:hypothetical protein